jgi:hypothetical protein
MVDWWMNKEAVQAKVTTADDGSYIMWMEGTKYPFPGYPRGHLLYGTLSKLKHEIKVQYFNDNWARLDHGNPVKTREAVENITELAKKSKFDMMPVDKMAPAVREINRCIPDAMWKDVISYIFQEDDAYRWRFQWMSKYLDKKDPVGSFSKAMDMLEHAEVVEDMKERIRLVKRVLLEVWKDPEKAKYWIHFVQNLDFKKVKLTKADKYFFRAKYFKVDYPLYEY